MRYRVLGRTGLEVSVGGVGTWQFGGEWGKRFEQEEVDVRSARDTRRIRKTLEQVQRIREEEVPEGVEMAQWALARCLKNPAVTCVIPGCKNVEQVESNAGAADLEAV